MMVTDDKTKKKKIYGIMILQKIGKKKKGGSRKEKALLYRMQASLKITFSNHSCNNYSR